MHALHHLHVHGMDGSTGTGAWREACMRMDSAGWLNTLEDLRPRPVTCALKSIGGARSLSKDVLQPYYSCPGHCRPYYDNKVVRGAQGKYPVSGHQSLCIVHISRSLYGEVFLFSPFCLIVLLLPSFVQNFDIFACLTCARKKKRASSFARLSVVDCSFSLLCSPGLVRP